MSEKITIEPIDEETRKARAAIYTSPGSSMVDMTWVKPYNLFMPKNFEYMMDDIKNFEVREDDIFMVTYPKAGSTLVQVNKKSEGYRCKITSPLKLFMETQTHTFNRSAMQLCCSTKNNNQRLVRPFPRQK